MARNRPRWAVYVWCATGFLAVSYIATILSRTPVLATGLCVGFVIPLAGRIRRRRTAVLVSALMGCAGGAAILSAMVLILQSRSDGAIPPWQFVQSTLVTVGLVALLCALAGWIRWMLAEQRRQRLEDEWSLFDDLE